MQHDLNLFKLQVLSFTTLTTGINHSSSVMVDSNSMGVMLDFSQLTGATVVSVVGEGSDDNITFNDVDTVGIKDIVIANLDADLTKRVFSISSRGLYKYYRIQLTITGTPSGSINAISYQYVKDGIDINNNKK